MREHFSLLFFVLNPIPIPEKTRDREIAISLSLKLVSFIYRLSYLS